MNSCDSWALLQDGLHGPDPRLQNIWFTGPVISQFPHAALTYLAANPFIVSLSPTVKAFSSDETKVIGTQGIGPS